MLSGVPLKGVIEKIGHKKGTTTKDLVKFLRKCKIKCAGRLTRIKDSDDLPKTCILKLRFTNKSKWHWMVYTKDKIWDPLFGTTYPTYRLCEFYITPHNLSSYLEIFL